jgi:hypothetical protein
MHSNRQFIPARSVTLHYRFPLVITIGFCCAFLLSLLLWNLGVAPPPSDSDPSQSKNSGPAETAGPALSAQPAVPTEAPILSPAFTAEVRYWEPQILDWAAEHQLDPNLVATLIQIESCGNPQAVSSAGARGLFQVMPFHFSAGEEMLDPETNARRGLDFLVQSLALTDGHVGMALAGYNGGQAAALGGWANWPRETRRYYRWGNGIYNDVASGLIDSPTLHDWLAAGGDSLCKQADAVLQVRPIARSPSPPESEIK